MEQSKPKTAMSLTVGDMIVEHPYTGERGAWMVASAADHCHRHVELTLCTDGGNGEAQDVVLSQNHKCRVRASVEEIQHDAAMALMAITRKGLPPLAWTINTHDGHLQGSFTPYARDEDPQEVAAAWAEFLDAEPVFLPAHGDPDHGYERMEGHFEGVTVDVVVHGLPCPAEEKAPVSA